MIVKVQRNSRGPDTYNSPWEVVANTGAPEERQVFTTRSEAREFARIRNRVGTFSEACREYASGP